VQAPAVKAVSLNGAFLVAEAMRQINPDLVAAYPITPQTLIVERFSEYVANGEVDTEFVTVESEHSAMSVCVGAAAAGGRVQTATTSAGMALMWEILYVAAGSRLPIVMHFVNRALSAPINIHCDHSDSMGARDSGWMQLYAENGQEAYDNAIQASRIAEHPDVLLPILHTQDGFSVSHSTERAEVLDDDAVKRFIGEYQPHHPLLDLANPPTYGPLALQDSYYEFKRQQADAMENALRVVADVGEEYGHLTGRSYGLIDEYLLEDAEYAIVVLGSTAGTAREAIKALRAEGIKAGMLKVRCFRPFPASVVANALKGVKLVGVMDRAASFGGAGNPLFMETCASLLSNGVVPKVVNYVYGLGGRDTAPRHIDQIFRDMIATDEGGSVEQAVRYVDIDE
jgi:pyruvate ferredoxin oxidoreductase alpha subunit